jgi:spore maturation protein CgeB
MRFLSELLQKESNVDYILFLNTALAEFVGVPNHLKSRFGVRTAVYEADFPMYFRYRNSLDLQSLLGFEGFRDFDLFLVNSQGVIPQLGKLGARNVRTLDFAADPEVYTPTPLKQDIDIGFFGYSSQDRENSMKQLIAQPSEQLPEVTFVVAGGKTKFTDLGRAMMWGDLPFSLFKSFCCRSKLNLNITKETFARAASTTSRLFELCCLGCCVVSNDIQGLSRYFKIGREIFVARNHEEAVDLYRWLLSSEQDRVDTGVRARERVLREHTYRHRAQQLIRDLARVE